MDRTEKTDPLALAKWLYRRYTQEPFEREVAQKKQTIVLEPTKRANKAQHAPSRSGEPWTDPERVALFRAVLEQKKVAVIALDHKRSPGAVQSEMKRLSSKLLLGVAQGVDEGG